MFYVQVTESTAMIDSATDSLVVHPGWKTSVYVSYHFHNTSEKALR